MNINDLNPNDIDDVQAPEPLNLKDLPHSDIESVEQPPAAQMTRAQLQRVPQPPVKAPPAGRIPDEAFAKAKQDASNDAIPFPIFAGAGLGNAAARVASNAGLMAADQGLKDPAKGFDVDAALHAGELGGGVSAAVESIPYVGKALGFAGRKAAQALTGVGGEAIDRYIANPAAVENAKPLFDQTKAFLGSTEETSKGLSNDSSKAFEILKSGGKTVKPEELTSPLTDAADRLESLGSFGPERKGAINYLRSLADDVNKDSARSGGVLNLISGDKGKALINVLDSKIETAAANGADAQILKSLGDARKSIDTFLKERSPEYAAHMKELATETGAYKDLADKFRSENGAMNTLKRIQNGKDPFAAEALKKYDAQFGTDFNEGLKDSAAKQQFTRDTTNGSRKTVGFGAMGAAVGSGVGGFIAPGVGHAVGGMIGGGIGSGVGMLADKFGGQAVKVALDAGIKVNNLVGTGVGMLADKFGGQAVKVALDAGIKVNNLVGTKYVAPVMAAALRGPQALAVTHYLLTQQDPEYQKLHQKTESTPDESPLLKVGDHSESD